MYMRLGFAVAIHVDPDVLLVDEVLAVGDEGFTHKCLDKFAEFRRRGRTVLLVTHALGLVERFCDEALWLEEGRAHGQGDPKRVVDAYLTQVEHGEAALLAGATAKAVASVAATAPQAEAADTSAQTPMIAQPDAELRNMFQAVEGRWGSREIEIAEVVLVDRNGEASFVFHTGESMAIRLKVLAHAPATDFAFGISLFNADGLPAVSFRTDDWPQVEPQP
jgi:ABC-type glutathione transport system ATPase component